MVRILKHLPRASHTAHPAVRHLVKLSVPNILQEECIPVGCVPAARSPYWGGVPGLGGCTWSWGGVPGLGGVPGQVLPSLLTESQTPVKTLLWPQLRCGR